MDQAEVYNSITGPTAGRGERCGKKSLMYPERIQGYLKRKQNPSQLFLAVRSAYRENGTVHTLLVLRDCQTFLMGTKKPKISEGGVL
ncbi:MAG: hypothetical protein WCT13_04070 [Patescibacteria group bacterium]